MSTSNTNNQSNQVLENELATLETLLAQLQGLKTESTNEACKAVQSTIDKLKKTLVESTVGTTSNEPEAKVEPTGFVLNQEHIRKLLEESQKRYQEMKEKLDLVKQNHEKYATETLDDIIQEQSEIAEMMNCKDVKKLLENAVLDLSVAESSFLFILYRNVKIATDSLYVSGKHKQDLTEIIAEQKESLFTHNRKILKLLKYLTVEQQKSMKLSETLDYTVFHVMNNINWKYNVLFTRSIKDEIFDQFISLESGLGIFYHDLEKVVADLKYCPPYSLITQTNKIMLDLDGFYTHIIAYPYETIKTVFENIWIDPENCMEYHGMKISTNQFNLDHMMENSMVNQYVDAVRFLCFAYPQKMLAKSLKSKYTGPVKIDENYKSTCFDLPNGKEILSIIRDFWFTYKKSK
jgi:hypothetical protein